MIQISDIVKADLCTGCGICVSEASDSLKMEFNDYGFFVPFQTKDTQTKAARVCPFNPEPEKIVKDEDRLAELFFNDTPDYHKRIGKYINTYVGFSKEYRESSSSGGVTTYIFEELLRKKIVDHLFIVKEVKGSYQYQWFNDVQQIKTISKTRYIPVTLENLFKEIDDKVGKVAVSGVACFVKAIRLKQYYAPQYKEKIPFLIGIICGGLKSRFFTDYLAQKSGIIGPYSKQEYRIKDKNSTASDYSFGAFDGSAKFHKMKMKVVGDMWGTGLFKANACDFCDDVTTELADISLGDAWIYPYYEDGGGTNVIVTRSPLAENLIKEGIRSSDLVVDLLSLNSFLASQQGSFNHRHNGLPVRIEVAKVNNKLVPPKRYENENVTSDFKIVQKQRMRVRAKSLDTWRNHPDARIFEAVMEKSMYWLRFYTKIYHRRKRLENRKKRLFEKIRELILGKSKLK